MLPATDCNPPHYAIALRYVREEGGAPLVLSKGKDRIAVKVREKPSNIQLQSLKTSL
jgi:flagellar biosynthesis protein FlhB